MLRVRPPHCERVRAAVRWRHTRAAHGVRFPGEQARAVLTLVLVLAGCTFGTPDETATSSVAELARELEAFAEDAQANGAPAVVFHVRNGDQEELKAAGVNELESNNQASPRTKRGSSGRGRRWWPCPC